MEPSGIRKGHLCSRPVPGPPSVPKKYRWSEAFFVAEGRTYFEYPKADEALPVWLLDASSALPAALNQPTVGRMRKCVGIIEGYGHFHPGQDGYQALLEIRQFFDRLAGNPHPYGYCPHCREPGESRERRPNGNDRCKNGHVYPSSAAVPLSIDEG